MKLTKKLEKEIRDVYIAFWNSYIKGDKRKFFSYLNQVVRMTGTTENEDYNNKLAVKKFIDDTYDQVVGKVEFRNRRISISPLDNYFLVYEQMHLYVLANNEWTFYSKVRISSLVQKNKAGWKFIQVHASIPDAMTEGGETIAMEKISKENLELREAVKRRTVELENKNRELEIESALEKVRTVAMGMKRPEDMLKVCSIISKQLKLLGTKDIRNVQTAIFNNSNTTYLNYEYFPVKNKSIITEIDYMLQPDVKAFAKRMMKAPDTFFTKSFKGSELKKWNQYQKKTKQFIDPRQYKATNLQYCFYSIGNGALGISVFTPLNEDEINIFKKFRNVFELAYKRFVDIQKAEAQAMEAKIEASLEKVRAQALGMHKPNDLLNVCKVLYKELLALGFTQLRNAIIHNFKDEKGYFIDYDYADQTGGAITVISYNANPIIKKFIKQIRRPDNSFVELTIKGNELKDWKKFRKKGGQPDDPRLNKASAINYYIYSISSASIGISTFDVINDEKLQLLKRFRNVFDFAYRRYMDVVQAEAQAREAGIELALERVRVRGMAMQSSEELGALIGTLFTELTKLDLVLTRCVTWIVDRKTNDAVWWMANSEDPSHPMSYFIPYHRQPPWLAFMKEWKKRTMKWVYDLKGKTKKNWDNFLFAKTSLAKMPKFIRDGMRAPDRVLLSASFNNFGGINVASLEPLSDEHFNILLRFAKVFDQTYTRFLDLKKAEAQAKEAKIELGLERVRARAMAMQNSDELAELVATVFKELTQLDFALTSSIIWIHDREHTTDTLWIASAEMNKPAQPFQIKPFHNDFFSSIVPAWKAKDPKWIFTLTGVKKKNFEKAFFKELPGLPDVLRKALSVPKQVVFSASFNNFGALEIVETEALTDEKFDILHRFGKVFDSSYTRFNDLKKAEAQTREAQVEAALEKIRSRSLAMHHSKELKDVIAVLFEKLNELNVLLGTVAIQLFDQNSMNSFLWVGNAIQDPQMVNMPYDKKMMQENGYLKDGWEAMREGRDIINKEYSLKEKNKFFKYVFANNNLTEIPENAREVLRKMRKHIICVFTEKNSALFVDSFYGQFFSKENLAVIQRAGKVFEQCYIRFLDLKKAEEQAREAQVEAALERTRTQSMIMQHSKELDDVLRVFHEQVLLLGINSAFSFLWLPDEDKDRHIFWAAWREDKNGPTVFKSKAINYPLDRNEPATAQCLVDWKSNELIVSYHVPPAGVENYFAAWEELIDGVEQLKPEYFSGGLYYVEAFMKYGCFGVMVATDLREDEKKLLGRFAIEFERAYTRFLDLQRAEAQAREAQIEASLERVRSKTMAMQRSEELDSVIKTVYSELKRLDVSFYRCFIMIFDEQKGATWWMGSPDDDLFHEGFYVQYHTHPPHLAYLKGWEQRQQKWEYRLGGQIKKDWDEFIFSQTALSKLPPIVIQDMKSFDLAHLSASFENFGCITTGGIEGLSEKSFDILSRFAKVFDQTYTRFNDLKQAEAQAREAQIETALERVRSRSMGMQKSEELKEVIKIVYEQLIHLKIKLDHTGFVVNYKPGGDWTFWIADEQDIPSKISHPYFESVWASQFNEAKEKGTDYFTTHLNFEEKNKFYRELLSYVPGLPETARDFYLNCPGLAATTVLFDSVSLYIENFSGIPYSDEENKTLMRFGKVFQQTYTRFLDLQKAEAQAREAEIQLALERVRARSLAMHHTSELQDVVDVLAQQLHQIGMDINGGVLITINDEVDEDLPLWASSGAADYVQKVVVPFFDRPIFTDLRNAIKRRNNFFANEYGKEEKDEMFDHLFRYAPWSSSPEERKKELLSREGGLTRSAAISQYTSIAITNHNGKKFSEEEHEILKRFGNVFEQSYTRFLDLQKAEAQAREAQIEAALEKVRSKTMAMQKSDELGDVATVLFKEMNQLVDNLWTCGFVLCENDRTEDEWWLSTETGFIPAFYLPNVGDITHANIYNGWRNGETYHTEQLEGQALQEHYDWLMNIPVSRKIFEDMFAAGFSLPTWQKLHCAYFSYGYLVMITQVPCPDEQIFKRFAQVFDQTYTRFLDLQKAEAQAREAQIEVSLERVRSRAMAMHKTEDLTSAVSVVFDELDKLQLGTLRCGIGILHRDKRTADVWTTAKSETGTNIQTSGDEPMDIHPLLQGDFDAWLRQEDFSYVLEGKDLENYYQVLTETNFQLPASASFDTIKKDHKQHYYVTPFEAGTLFAFRETEFTPEAKIVMKRFANVFNLTYKRFLDLEKAEAQARGAQIEAALERVRSKVMAMNSSKDLTETSLVFGEQLKKLGIDWQFSYFWLIEEDKDDNTFWITWPDNKTSTTSYSLAEADQSFKECIIAWRNQEKIHGTHVSVEYVQSWLDTFERITNDAGGVAVEIMKADNFKDGVYYYDAMIKFGSFGILMNRPTSDEEKNIQARFATEFERAYTRFLDLQKAEANAREAEIELGLERVRARAMAMQSSNELSDLVDTVFKELTKLDFALNWCIINLIDLSTMSNTVWAANPDIHKAPDSYHMKFEDYPFHDAMMKGYKERKTKFIYVIAGDEKKVYDEYLFKETAFSKVPEEAQAASRAMEKYVCSFTFSNFGGLQTVGNEPLSDINLDILERFGKVFDLTYTRFNDLKQAEAQAREAQIEASLERVRSKAMAMHSSNDLNAAVSVVFEELEKLNLGMLRCGIGILNKEKRTGDVWTTAKSEQGNILQVSGDESLDIHPLLQGAFDAWLKQKDFSYELQGEDMVRYYRALTKTNFQLQESQLVLTAEEEEKQYYYVTSFEAGTLFAFRETGFPEEAKSVMKRFANVFNLTYKRFLDLQKAEAQTREANIEVALERVRARALAMQEPEELKDVAQVLRNEMGALGVEELETASIYIHEKDSETAECWYALKDTKDAEKKMVADHFQLTLDETWVGREMKKFYLSDEKQISIVMQGITRKEWIEYCYKHSPVFSGFYGESIPDRTYHLYKFSHGYIGAAAPGDISAESWKLLGRAASVFSLAYSRFKDLTQARIDLQRLKEEKQRAESALTDLKSTQTQLIQAEKMASLGELTAGIAHEIQNPLNFVNNFSDVSNELLEEMKTELEKGNKEDAIAIAHDVKQNLEKILHHGKRADAIVKGMLQHSRTSSGQKEPTDINALADEYLRLSYHGLRAKDKTFNAKFEINCDSTIEKINVIAQDVGRVILNLINNAFYAVSEKKKHASTSSAEQQYEPMVTVTTKQSNGTVEIKVRDNGNGIPPKVLDKIFQPFFTTKPTGQGTGLGLSLSYDIITKGHGGELKVETKEGEGSEFIIQLPMT